MIFVNENYIRKVVASVRPPSWIAKTCIYIMFISFLATAARFQWSLLKKRTCYESKMKKKKSINKPGVLLTLILLLIFVLVVNGTLALKSESRELPKVIFYVSWFDVSEPVLDGLKGVELVNSDYHGYRERNTVWYDPALISVHEMETALKEAGIYQETAKFPWFPQYGIHTVFQK